MTPSKAKIISINVGQVRNYDHNGKQASSAFWKTPVEGPVAARGSLLEGDAQGNLKVHGGIDQAVYAYAREDLEWFAREMGQHFDPGHFGENLTTSGIDVSNSLIGERWRIADVELEITQARMPCATFAYRMNDKTFPKRFLQARRPGAYFRILKEGAFSAGDTIEVTHRPNHDVTIATAFHIYGVDHNEAERFINLPGLSARWQKWAADMVQKKNNNS